MSMQTMQQIVRIRAGYEDPALGDIGGWEAVALRRFTVQGVAYIDVELTGAAIAAVPGKEKTKFFERKLVFTRIRIAEKNTQPSPAQEDPSQRAKAIAQVQREWFEAVGSHEKDPTKTASEEDTGSDRESPDDEGRRQMLKAVAMIGMFAVMFSLSQCEECNNGSRGSWGRFGGGYSS